jgi:hypothetical protein
MGRPGARCLWRIPAKTENSRIFGDRYFMGQVKTAAACRRCNYLRRTGNAHASAIAPALSASEQISSECWLGLYQQAIALTGDADLPLRVGASVSPAITACWDSRP